MNRYQFVRWRSWHGFGFNRHAGHWGTIYRWSLFVGFWEIRRWADTEGGAS